MARRVCAGGKVDADRLILAVFLDHPRWVSARLSAWVAGCSTTSEKLRGQSRLVATAFASAASSVT